jgi:hypothetical protein
MSKKSKDIAGLKKFSMTMLTQWMQLVMASMT